MSIISPELIFTKKELDEWLDSIGGAGTEVTIPEDAYFLNRDKQSIKLKHYNAPLINKKLKVVGITKYGDEYHINLGSSWYLLWPGMKNVCPKIIVNPYPHICKFCHSPARKCADNIFCSNYKCKSRKVIKYIKAAKLINDKDNPIIVYCSTCNSICIDYKGGPGGNGSAKCPKCGRYVSYRFEINQWYASKCSGHEAVRYLGEPLWWTYSEIKDINNDNGRT